ELDTERAVVLLDVARPELLAAEVETLQDARAGHHPHVLAVGDRRGRRHVLLVADAVASRDRALPHDILLVAVDGPELDVARGSRRGHIQEDEVFPDDRRRAAEG